MKAIHTELKLATALMSMALVNGSIGDAFGQSPQRRTSTRSYWEDQGDYDWYAGI